MAVRTGTGTHRKKYPRFSEIAELAGVSTATVDRVLNERESVSERARSRVIAAAKQLGVPRILPPQQHGLIHLDVLLPINSTPFFRRLNVALLRSIEMLDKQIVVHRSYLAEHKNDAFARAVLRPPYRRQGLILAAPDTEPVRDALRIVSARGETAVAIVTNVKDVPGLKYAGIDNYRAGRTAGYFIGRLSKNSGRVVILSNRTDYQGHVDRVAGCRDVLRSFGAKLVCDSRTIETYDDPDRCYLAVANALRNGDPVAAIYNSGAGSSGIETALRKFSAAGNVCWVTHEMSDDHRQYLQQGILDLVIDQDPDGQIITALQHLLHGCRVLENEPPANEPSEFRLYFAENLRATPYLHESR